MNSCPEHGDTDVFYPDHFALCPLCKAEIDARCNLGFLRAEQERTKQLAHALHMVPNPRQMDFMVMTWQDAEKYRKWYEGIRSAALSNWVESNSLP